MHHIMMDLETWGKLPGCALRSIGAVSFDRTTIGAEFYANIEKQSCQIVGLHVDPETEKWWGRQSPAAQELLEDNPQTLRQVINDFHAWVIMQGGRFVWANSPSFDVVIWEAAVRAAGMTGIPWKFRDVRDTRTLFHMAKYRPRRADNVLPHFALEDAKIQAKWVQEARNMIEPAARVPGHTGACPTCGTKGDGSGWESGT